MQTYFSGLRDFGIAIFFILISLVAVSVLAWLIYNKIILKRISLKKELFEDDSFSVWLDFAGAVLMPILFLVSVIMSPNGKFIYNSKWIDIVNIILYILFYLVFFSVCRFAAEWIVSLMAEFEIRKKVSLINEIYFEKNISAAIFSISISVVVISLLLHENFLNEDFISNIIRLSFIFILTVGLLSIYKAYFFPINAQLFKELFIVRNTCTGILVLGQVIAVSLIINSAINWLKISVSGWLNIGYLIDLTLFISFMYLIMLVTVSIIKSALNFIFKTNIDKELFEQNNIGYSFTESSFYIILSLMIANSFLV